MFREFSKRGSDARNENEDGLFPTTELELRIMGYFFPPARRLTSHEHGLALPCLRVSWSP
jgi:hypothetical protein